MTDRAGEHVRSLDGIDGARLRLVSEDDAAALAEAVRTDRAFLAPWDPERDDTFFTVDGQRAVLSEQLRWHEAGLSFPYVIELDGRIVGRLNLVHVTHGAFCSADLGYWVAQRVNGRGLASAAVAAALRLAFEDLGLHRVQAATLLHNHASQRVLVHNGFVRIGLAPAYLRIAGRWQDHLLFQRLADG